MFSPLSSSRPAHKPRRCRCQLGAFRGVKGWPRGWQHGWAGRRGGERTEVIPRSELLGLCLLNPDLLGVVHHNVHELVKALHIHEEGLAHVRGRLRSSGQSQPRSGPIHRPTVQHPPGHPSRRVDWAGRKLTCDDLSLDALFCVVVQPDRHPRTRLELLEDNILKSPAATCQLSSKRGTKPSWLTN